MTPPEMQTIEQVEGSVEAMLAQLPGVASGGLHAVVSVHAENGDNLWRPEQSKIVVLFEKAPAEDADSSPAASPQSLPGYLQFEPMKMEGEPLSEMIMRERGPR
jgi:hypothetical protein